MNNTKKGGGCFFPFMFMIVFVIICMVYVNSTESPASSSSSYGVTDTEDTTGTGDDSDTASDTLPSDTPDGSINDAVEDSGYIYWYYQLNSAEKHLYGKMIEALGNGKDSFTVEGINYDEYGPAVERAIYAVTYDYPIYFWVTNGFTTEYFDRSGTANDEITFFFDYYSYWDYTMSPDKYREKLEAEVERVVALADDYTDPFEQALFVHDYLIQNAEYDYDALEEAKKTIHDASSEYIYCAYGCLVNKKTVCSGYAEAFQLIMNELGVNCTTVVGDAGGPHAWNMIELDGELYYIDITWDDSDYKNDSGVFTYPNDAEYEYMCITTQELSKTHTPDSEMFIPPVCTATKYNYFVHRGYYADVYSYDTVYSMVEAQAVNKRIISVRFGSEYEFKRAVNDLIDGSRAFDIPSLSDGYRYIDDQTHFTLKFYID